MKAATNGLQRLPPALPPGLAARTRCGSDWLGTRVLILADGENLSYGLRRDGYDLDFARLRALVAARSGRLHAHAFATAPPGAPARYAYSYFTAAGWEAHVSEVETVRTCRGPQRRANSDAAILLGCGRLAALLQPDTVVLATGDGDLGSDMARFLKQSGNGIQVVVCSVPGSTSRRLRPGQNPDIDANVWLGRDCVVPLQ